MSDEHTEELPSDVQDLVHRLFKMAREGNTDLVDYVRQGVNVDLMNQDGNTFLMLAAYRGHADLVRGLIEVGADVDKRNKHNQAPLAGAIFKKYDDVVDVLIDAGADPTVGHPTAVETATMFGRDDLLERLNAEQK
ncbi:hypothetical protein C3B44_08850 [Corynebacterium yudongzhengii]|uniref:Ankyrin repeat domain-containing protein n=1 Tax=Corynebacterium yudongzhengii TaxID=2080740 RepID=A0A2U1T9B1_9CORY|nr:ankyrin repeat domain-containing protein [Corynebacterium yudongzhengii]AWB83022.1 hypothetical protein C3B44_08850 [Corynebacterium yudongzhengii]PWC02525.1 ankyrin repeat domain-containing protein [Corynebacterium yudongzhengii]